MKERYIHYGHSRFYPQLFVDVTNIQYFIKPNGGLWASPVNAKYGWKDWCEDENFRECNEKNSFTFTLSDDAKVIHIRSVDDLAVLPKQRLDKIDVSYRSIDFEKLLADGWDAVELHLSEERTENLGFMEGLYWELYGWDCDSILIMNPDVIVTEV